MTTSLGKRSSVNGISDIAYKVLKAPVNTSGDQFVQGVKTYSQPIKALTDVYCYGKYYGDGSQLTNVTGLDPSKLPLAGGTITGTVNFDGPTALTVEISEIGIGMADPDNQWNSSLKANRLGIDDGNTTFYSVTKDQSQFEGAAGYNTQSAAQIQLESNLGNTLLLTTAQVAFNLNQSISSTLTQSGLTFINETTDIHSAYFDASAALVNGSNTNISTALNQILNDGNGNSNEITNQSVFIKEDGGGKDATYGLISSRHRNENTYDSCVTQVGINPDGYVGFTVQAGIDTEVSEVFMGYKTSSAQPELTVSDNRFIKWNTGTSLRIREQDGDKIQKWDSAQVNNGNYGQFNFQVHTEYLDANGQGGWTVTIINPGNLPEPTINSPDIYFVGSQFGVQTNFQLPKWTAARFILTPTPNAGYPYDFVWLVSF